MAGRSRGTPRIANRLLKRVRDFATVKGNGIISEEIAKLALNRLEVEMLSPIYLYLEIYGHTLERAKLKEYIDTFERVCLLNGIDYLGEHMTLYKKLVLWRSLLWAKEI